jgi:hypothetical protein
MGFSMAGIEGIMEALTAGAYAGVTGSATIAVQDAYKGLRDALRRRLAARPGAEDALGAQEVDAGDWQSTLRADLIAVGADKDAAVLEAARRLLEVIDAAGCRSPDARGAGGVAAGNRSLHVASNYGVAATTIDAPVTINFGQVPVPPSRPATTQGHPSPASG